MRRGAAAILFSVVSIGLLVVMQVLSNSVAKQQAPSSRSGRAQGMSLAFELMRRTGRIPTRLEQPVLSNSALVGIDTLIIASPLRRISGHEAGVIEDFVRRGGQLYLTFHDEATYNRVMPLINVAPHADKRFRNREVVDVGGLSFYAPLVLGGEPCIRSERLPHPTKRVLECYLREITVGNGKIVLQAGLPLLANGLIGLPANRSWAAEFVVNAGRVAFDDYHHFFNEKSWLDLGAEPSISLPILGATAALLAFLLWGQGPQYARPPLTPPPPPTFHQLGAAVLQFRLRRRANWDDAAELHAELLRQALPEAPETSQQRGVHLSAELIAHHRRYLLARGHHDPRGDVAHEHR